ncbi:hypothetical protein F5X97DRAFT_319703 [Nemania serpens]|nr:hypothetical protein F5X97DRAFT_319703 [Nemania serpens]
MPTANSTPTALQSPLFLPTDTTSRDKKMESLSSANLTNVTIPDSPTPTQQPSGGKNTNVAMMIAYGIPGLVVGAVIGLIVFRITRELGNDTSTSIETGAVVKVRGPILVKEPNRVAI